MTALRQLKETLELRFPEAMPIARGLAPAVSTGVAALDAALPNGGLPRGCLTIWRGGAGATALLRAACVETVARGERTAWVDGARTTLGDFWPRGVMVVRPARRQAQGQGLRGGTKGKRSRTLDTTLNSSLNTREVALRALAGAEELLRSGGFALVVVTGVPAGLEAELVRVSRVAREGGGAVVVLTAGGGEGKGSGAVAAARLRIESWYRPEGHRWRTGVFGEAVEIETMAVGARIIGTGWLKHVNLQLPVLHHAYRLSLDPGLVDRRGVPARASGLGAPARELRFSDDTQRAPLVEGVQLGVQPSVGAGVESAGGAGLAGAGEAGGGAAGGGAAPEDRGAGSDLGGRPWTGRAPLRRGAVRAAG